MSRDNPITYLRIPEDVKARVKQEAAENGRSMTGEIIFQLRRAYQIDPPDTKKPPEGGSSGE